MCGNYEFVKTFMKKYWSLWKNKVKQSTEKVTWELKGVIYIAGYKGNEKNIILHNWVTRE